jgi:hypothetical protein
LRTAVVVLRRRPQQEHLLVRLAATDHLRQPLVGGFVVHADNQAGHLLAQVLGRDVALLHQLEELRHRLAADAIDQDARRFGAIGAGVVDTLEHPLRHVRGLGHRALVHRRQRHAADLRVDLALQRVDQFVLAEQRQQALEGEQADRIEFGRGDVALAVLALLLLQVPDLAVPRRVVGARQLDVFGQRRLAHGVGTFGVDQQLQQVLADHRRTPERHQRLGAQFFVVLHAGDVGQLLHRRLLGLGDARELRQPAQDLAPHQQAADHVERLGQAFGTLTRAAGGDLLDQRDLGVVLVAQQVVDPRGDAVLGHRRRGADEQEQQTPQAGRWHHGGDRRQAAPGGQAGGVRRWQSRLVHISAAANREAAYARRLGAVHPLACRPVR